MTFDPRFAFFRDDPQPDSCETLEDMAAEAARAHAQRAARYPELVRKGRMSSADADRELRVMAAIAADLALHHDSFRAEATWSEQIESLRREILLRRAAYGDAGNMRVRMMESIHYMKWFMTWSADAVAARADVERREAA